jgi:hypothetical protein
VRATARGYAEAVRFAAEHAPLLGCGRLRVPATTGPGLSVI